MLKKAAALFCLCASTGVWTGCGSTTSHFVYAAIPAANQVAAYREDPNSGVLTVISGSPFTAATAAQSLAIHPSKKFLYVANSGDNNISLFTISSKGALAEVTPRTPAGMTPVLLAMDSAGSFLYVANSGSSNISVFSITSGTGALTAVPGSPSPIGISPLNMKLSPSGGFLYVTGSTGSVEAFTVTAGALKVLGGFQTNGISPYGLAIDPTGTYLYTANFGSNSISEFTIGSNGALAAMSNSPLGGASLTAPISLLVDPSGKYLYVANDVSSGSIAAFSIGAGGALTPLTTSTFGTGGQPNSLAADPSGKYLFVGSQSSSVQVFKKSSDGTLASVATYSTGGTPTSIAVLQP
jgi:6-phosphogluconolactonase (cycloisomerase 2 family)